MSRSWSDQRDVLYVNDALTGQEVGSFDRQSGEFAVLDPIRVRAVAQALWDFLDYGRGGGDGDGGGVVEAVRTVEAEWAAPIAPEPEPSTAPSVATPSTTPTPSTPSTAPSVATAPTPSAALASPTPTASNHRAGRVLDRALARLRRDGWVVLSPGGKRVGADFDRLIIGPAGVFALTLKEAGATAGPHDRGHDAGSATQFLSAATGLAVKVRPVIVFVGAGIGRIDECAFTGQDGAPCEALSARGESIVEMLWSLPAVYSAQERHRFLDVARHADFWRAA